MTADRPSSDTESGPGPTGRPPLRRPVQGRMLGGVAAGLADHLGVDVAIVRVVLVVLALITNGLVAVAYVAAILIIPGGDAPAAGSPTTPAAGSPTTQAAANTTSYSAMFAEREPSFWVGIAMLIVAGILLLGGPLAPHRIFGGALSGDVIVALVLIAFGFALWKVGDRPKQTDRSVPGSPAPPSSPPTAGPAYPFAHVASAATKLAPPTTAETMMSSTNPPPSDGRPPDGEDAASTDLTEPIAAPADDPVGSGAPEEIRDLSDDLGDNHPASPDGDASRFTPPPVATRQRSMIGRATAGVAFMAVGLVWLLDSFGAIDVSGVQIAATALLVVGIGLIISAFVGRARGLIVVGMLLVPFVLLAALVRPYTGFVTIDNGMSARAGDVTETPATIAELRSEYRMAAGRYVIDLTDLDLDAEYPEPVTVIAEMGAGELIVRLPDNVTANLNVRVGVGDLDILGASHGWIGIERSSTIIVGDGTHLIDLDLRLGVGQLSITAPTSTATQEVAR